MNTHKFFTLAALLTVAISSVAMADNVVVQGADGSQKGSGATIKAAVSTTTLTSGDSINLNASTKESGATDLTVAPTVDGKSITINGNNNVIGRDLDVTDSKMFFASNLKNTLEDEPCNLTLTLSNITFNNGYRTNGHGGVLAITGDNPTIIATNTTFSNCVAGPDKKGGAIYTETGLTFDGANSKITFTNNKANSTTANDIYSVKDVTFKNTGVYTLDGGIESTGNLYIQEGANVTFQSGATNNAVDLSIAGNTTQAQFEAGTTSTVTGKTTIDGTSAGNVAFNGKQTFGEVTVSNAGNATFGSGSESTGALLTITDDTSKVVFQGTQQFTNMYIQKGATAEIASTAKFNNTATTVTGQGSEATVAAGATFTNSSIIADNRGELTISESFNSPITITAQNAGVVNLDSDKDFTFTGNLKVLNGGTVNFTGNTDKKLTIGGTLSGNNGNLNLAIKKSTEQTFEGLTYYNVGGQTLNVNTLSLTDGNEFIKVLASDFNYHDETTKFEFLTLSSGIEKDDFYAIFDLPFSWFASTSPDTLKGFEFKTEAWDNTATTIYLYKVDGDKVPEPSTWALLILGSVGLYFIRRKKSAK